MTELEPLSPELAALCAAERDRPDGSDAAADRLMSRLRDTLLLPPGGGGGPGGDGSGGGAGASTLAPPAGAALALKPIAAIAAAFVLGAGAGAAAMAAYQPAPPAARMQQELAPRVVLIPSAEQSMPAASPTLSPEDLALEPPRPASPAKAPPRTPTRDVDLARERSLIGMARTALAKRDGRAAIAALDRHAREFPGGRLSEERDSLRVQGLMLAGDRGAAERQAQSFQEKYPKSLLKGAVDESLEVP